jgi:N-carbamoyl-L-amino-acid hydrolase
LLDKEKIPIGIVEKIAAPSTLRVELTGVGGHAGAVLMPGRHDALLAGAEIALAVEKAALTTGSPDTVATTGVFQIEPGAVNSVPCRAHLSPYYDETSMHVHWHIPETHYLESWSDAPGMTARFDVQPLIAAICDPKLVALLAGTVPNCRRPNA